MQSLLTTTKDAVAAGTDTVILTGHMKVERARLLPLGDGYGFSDWGAPTSQQPPQNSLVDSCQRPLVLLLLGIPHHYGSDPTYILRRERILSASVFTALTT